MTEDRRRKTEDRRVTGRCAPAYWSVLCPPSSDFRKGGNEHAGIHFWFFAGAILAAAALIYVLKDEIKATAIKAWDERMAGISSAGDDGKPDR
jgi:hypothetical protein